MIFILESLGCHKINPNFGKDELRCALPDGETPTSVSVRLDEFLGCYVFSRGDYDRYEIKDIITLVQFVLNISFEQAVLWLCNKLEIEHVKNYTVSQELTIINEIKKKERAKKKNEHVEVIHEILDNKILNKYCKEYVKEWVDEGISCDIQDKYGIRIDKDRMRYLIPIYDEYNNLISIKGRGYMPNIKELNISKYIYYYKLGVNDILFGLNFNKQNIIKRKELVIFEGEKSVMKADSYGYNWCVSVGKNGINPHLLNKILTLRYNVVIAFDKDVDISKVYIEARKLNMFTNVYAVIDKCGYLDKKDAPVDKGKEVWDKLYSEKRRIV